MFTILLIEDDPKLSALIQDSLQKYGFRVICPEDFTAIEPLFETMKPHLILLDLNLPYYDGFYFCRMFRRKSTAPILILSARSGDLEQVMGMELGADDYMIKPFSIELLQAKVRAVLRRAYGEYALAEDNRKEETSGLFLDDKTFRAHYMGRSAELSKNEYKLLKKLTEHSGAIVSREDLLAELWDDSTFVDDNTLTVNVTRVKHKLAELGIRDAIRTKRGAGYLLDTASLEGGNDR